MELKFRLLCCVMLAMSVVMGAWAQEAKFVSRPTEEEFIIQGLNVPMDAAVDQNGYFYTNVANTGEVRIYKPDGTLHLTFGHLVTNYTEEDPTGFLGIKNFGLDKDNNIYVCEGKGNRVRVFNSVGEPLLVINMPEYLASIVNEAGTRVYKTTSPPEAKNLPGTKYYEKGFPWDAAVSSNGNIYVTDGSGDQVVVFDYEGNLLTTFEYYTAEGQMRHFSNPSMVAFNSKGELFVSLPLTCKIVVTDAKGNFLRTFGRAGNTVGTFQRLTGVAIDDLDRVYCADFVIGSVQVFDDQGNFLHILTDKGGEQWKVTNVGGIAVDMKRIYLVETMANRFAVRKFVK